MRVINTIAYNDYIACMANFFVPAQRRAQAAARKYLYPGYI